MRQMRHLLAAIAIAAAALAAGCEADEFADAPTARAPDRAQAHAEEPASAQEPAQRPAASNSQNLPADHPPINSGGSQQAGSVPAPSQDAAMTPEQFGKVGPLRWEAPKGWRAVKPSSNMRLAEYLLPAQSGGEPATMTVFYFGKGGGGSIQDNIDRWVGQFETLDGEADQSERTANGLDVHLVDASGTFNAGAMMGGGQAKSDWRLLGAIAETQAGNFFFKVTGPSKTVEAHAAGFESFISSLKAASDAN
jgi:hypothetical protein